MKRRIARSVVSIRHTSGLPPAGGSVAATIDSLCTSRLTHRRTSAGANEVTSDTAGPPQVVCGSGLAALNIRNCQPATDATHEGQPHASILTNRPATLRRPVPGCYLDSSCIAVAVA